MRSDGGRRLPTTPALKPAIPFSQRASRSTGSPISYLMEQGLTNPGVISLAAGFVDQDSLPVAEVERAFSSLMSDPTHARQWLQYGTTLGYPPLRDHLAGRLAKLDGLLPGENDICGERLIIGTGSQQLLYLVGEVLLDPGDIVIAGVPTYFVYMGALQSLGARIEPIATDEDGLVPDALDDTLARLQRSGELSRVKFIYDVSYFNNPTGLSLSKDRRARVVEIAKQWSRDQRIHVVEDAAYRELDYVGDELPSMLRFDEDASTVIYAGTFSKPFAPGVRTGYVVAPRDLVPALVEQKGHHDFGSANLTQGLALEVLENGGYDRHLAKLRNVYSAKLTGMLDALENSLSSLSGLVSWTKPHGGLYVWLRTPDSLSTASDGPLFRDCLAAGVLYVPGDFCYPPSAQTLPRNFVRLSFGHPRPDRCREGIDRFSSVLRRHVGAAAASAN